MAGLVGMFQTFEDLKSVKTEEPTHKVVRRIVDEDIAAQGEEVACYFLILWEK